MSSPNLERFLARLYSDERLARRFIETPDEVLAGSSLDARERQAMLAIDPLELQMACHSFAAKRDAHRPGLTRRLRHLLQDLLG